MPSHLFGEARCLPFMDTNCPIAMTRVSKKIQKSSFVFSHFDHQLLTFVSVKHIS